MTMMAFVREGGGNSPVCHLERRCQSKGGGKGKGGGGGPGTCTSRPRDHEDFLLPSSITTDPSQLSCTETTFKTIEKKNPRGEGGAVGPKPRNHKESPGHRLG